MDGGVHALKGFLYQATVILDLLLAHFEQHPDARARPEGDDDLELTWTVGGEDRRSFIQIKKPREDDSGGLKHEAWSLREIIQALLPTSVPSAAAPVVRTLSADDIVAAIQTRTAPQRPFQVSCASEAELRQLISLLDPANDHVRTEISTGPRLALADGGARLVESHVEYRDNLAGLRQALRPAVAVANRFGVVIPWHESSLSNERYLAAFFEQLAIAGDDTRFYDELGRRPDAVPMLFASSERVASVRALLDVRMVPLLRRYEKAGDDRLLEGLCAVACHRRSPRVPIPAGSPGPGLRVDAVIRTGFLGPGDARRVVRSYR